MEKAYIILAHKLPDQLFRLVERLNDGSSTFFIHIDIKANLEEFGKLSEFGDKVQLVKREDGKWGKMGINIAVLNGLRAIREFNKKIERIIVLSGQDYPIKSNEYINHFFRTSPYSVFIEHWPMPNFEIWKYRGGMFRLDKYFFGLKRSEKLKAKALNCLAMFIPFLRRKLPYNLLPYGGWSWWTIDMYALDYILQFLKDHPKYIKFNKYSISSDEMFIHTILLNSKDEKLLKSITNNYLRCIFWESYSNSHPKTLGKNDLNDIEKSDALFARKFDITKDGEILDLIDKNCLFEYQLSYDKK